MADNERLVDPNPHLLKNLMELGIKKEVAKKALILTNNESLELALSLALDLNDDDDGEMVPEKYLMAFVVNISLKMDMGETASQVSSATLGLYHEALGAVDGMGKISVWRQDGEPKAILKGKDGDDLKSLELLAISAQVPCLLITDQIKKRSATTVLAMFGDEVEIKKLIGQLPPL